TVKGFRRNVAHNKAVGTARKASVRDQGYIFTEPCAHDGGGNLKHFGHAGTALRTYVANYDHIALYDMSLFYGLHGVVFTVKHPRGTLKELTLLSRNFSYGALWRYVAIQDLQMSGRLQWFFHGGEDV